MRELFKFGAVGALSVAIHYGIYYLSMNLLGPTIAYTIGYAVSFVANFLLSSYFTFRVEPTLKKLLGFGGSHVINYLLQIAVLNGALWLNCPKAWAPLFAYAIAIPVNFLLVRFVLKRA